MNDQGNKEKDYLNRREFFRLAAKKVLPIIGGIALGPVLLSSCEKVEEEPRNCTDCSRSCYISCSGKNRGFSGNNQHGCSSSCFGSCEDTCTDSCNRECLGGCLGTCSGGCTKTCANGCDGGCGNSCLRGCKTGCAYDCETGCSQTCKARTQHMIG